MILKFEIKNIARLLEIAEEEEIMLPENYSEVDLLKEIWSLLSYIDPKKPLVV